MVNESCRDPSSQLNGWGGAGAASSTAKQPLQLVPRLLFVHVNTLGPQASSLSICSSFLAAHHTRICLDSPICCIAQPLTYRWVVQVNMATWSKAELAVAMGTSQDGSRAHELGTH